MGTLLITDDSGGTYASMSVDANSVFNVNFPSQIDRDQVFNMVFTDDNGCTATSKYTVLKKEKEEEPNFSTSFEVGIDSDYGTHIVDITGTAYVRRSLSRGRLSAEVASNFQGKLSSITVEVEDSSLTPLSREENMVKYRIWDDHNQISSISGYGSDCEGNGTEWVNDGNWYIMQCASYGQARVDTTIVLKNGGVLSVIFELT